MQGRMVYVHALTPVHTGTGQAAAIIDLPIAREKATSWPVLPGSGIKGVLRAEYEGKAAATWVQRAFGSAASQEQEAGAGALCFADQRILLFPARSYFGTFAWVTCPLALSRLRRDVQAISGAGEAPQEPSPPREMEALVAAGSALARDGKVYLEDLDLTATANLPPAWSRFLGERLFPEPADRDAFGRQFAVVANDVFTFLCESATEVTARVRLDDDTKTVKKGGLWYEEAVPAEAVFAGPVVVAGHRAAEAAALLQPLQEVTVQIGGKASVGRGLCRVIVSGGTA